MPSDPNFKGCIIGQVNILISFLCSGGIVHSQHELNTV